METFSGFKLSDFESIAGSTWRSRRALGGILNRHLSTQTGQKYQSWGVRRRTELHLAQEEFYNFNQPLPCAKLFVYTGKELACGFYVETPETGSTHDIKVHQHWQTFKTKLLNQSTMQAVLLEPMSNHGLILADYYFYCKGDMSNMGAIGCQFKFKNGRLHWSRPKTPIWQPIEINVLMDRISQLPETQWVDLHLFATMDKHEAVKKGVEVLDPILNVLRSLTPLYQMTVNKE